MGKRKFERCFCCKGPRHFGVCRFAENTFKGMTYEQVEKYVKKHDTQRSERGEFIEKGASDE